MLGDTCLSMVLAERRRKCMSLAMYCLASCYWLSGTSKPLELGRIVRSRGQIQWYGMVMSTLQDSESYIRRVESLAARLHYL
jgi:hypothetical protein